MALNVKKAKGGGGGNRVEQPEIENGTYPCRVVQIIDLGIQPQRPYQGKQKPPAHMLNITYEFLDEFCVDENGEEQEDKPRWLSEDFPLHNLEADRAKSTQRYLALDPKVEHDGDFLALAGLPCLVTTVQNPGKGQNAGKVYTNIGGLSTMRPKDAAKAPELVNPPKLFDLDNPDMEVFGSLPEFLQEKIKGNLEFNGSPLDIALNGERNAEEPDEADEQPEAKENVDAEW